MAGHAHQHKPGHREYAGEDLVEAARKTLTGADEQWTGMREAVFEELARHEKPASAYDIADNLSKSRGKRVAPNSVYRILDLFVGANLARRVESANAYVANAHPDCLHDCIFLVCDSCGQTTHLDDDAITKTVRAAATGAGFSPVRPVIEVRGKCADCDAPAEGTA